MTPSTVLHFANSAKLLRYDEVIVTVERVLGVDEVVSADGPYAAPEQVDQCSIAA